MCENTFLITVEIQQRTVAKRAGHFITVTTSSIYSQAIQSADEMVSMKMRMFFRVLKMKKIIQTFFNIPTRAIAYEILIRRLPRMIVGPERKMRQKFSIS